ncbi:MAG: glycoside hydrolase [Acidobacteria bacterium]|nr:glycoside hydrolase [Acidobacteriota bacterium]
MVVLAAFVLCMTRPFSFTNLGQGSKSATSNKSKGDFFEYLVCPAGLENARNTEASILQLKDGRLLMAWSDFYTNNSSDWAPSRISAKISADGGRTWRSKHTLQENIAKTNVMSPELLRLKSGKILFLFWANHSPADCQIMWRISNDEAKTWSEPKPLPLDPVPAYWMNLHDCTIQLKSGRIVNPLYYTEDYRINKLIRVRPYFSDNEAKTWKPSRTIISVSDGKITAEEPTVVELKDGAVLMLIRNSTKRIHKAYSYDQGETWSTPVPTQLAAAPRSPVKAKRIPSTGDLLVVWNNAPDKRCPLTTAISRDEGKTWQHIKNLEEDTQYTYAYSSITFLDQRVIFTYYVAKAETPSPSASESNLSLKLKCVPVEWLYE